MPLKPRRLLTLTSVALVAGLLAPILGGAAPAAAAAAAVASSSSGSSTSRNSITLNRPAGTAAGHVMVGQIVSNDDDPGFTAPADWTLVSDRSILNALRQAVYVKVAGSTEPASYTWTLSDFRRVAGGITAYSGIDTTTPLVDAAATSVNSTASTSVPAPPIVTTVPNTMLVHLAALNAEGTLTAPSGMTERWEATSPRSFDTRDALASASDAIQPAAGDTGGRAATATRSGRSIGTLLALRPAAPTPPPETDPPDTTITLAPPATTTTSSATFEFTADEPSTFQCSLDGAAFAACSSPKTYTVGDGTHTFAVRAVDLAGNIDPTPDTATWTADLPVPDPVIVGAGDIAGCGSTGDEATANVLDGVAGTVFTAGDNVYNDGTAAQFANCYNPTWGRHKARTLLPSPGNHDYNTGNANGYFGYFGAAAGDPSKGYYAKTMGAWQVIVLNSNCTFVGGCGVGSPQETWLRSVLQTSTAPCTVAIMHHARFSSGTNHGSNPTYQPFWQALYDFGADVVINGHEHVYERFAPQTPSGVRDDDFGIRQFTVGTGGTGHYGFASALPNSERRNADTFGVLKLTLHATSYDWQFVPQAGRTFTDSDSASCHGAPGTPPPPPPPPPTGGPIAPVASSSSGSSSSRTSITLNRPAGTATGHVMVAQIVSNDDSPGFTAPAGWTLVNDRSIVDALLQAVYVKVAGSSEPGSYTWTLSDFRRVAGGITTYSGVDTTNPVNASGVLVNNTASTNVAAPSITTTVADTRLVQLAAINAEGTLSPPAGMAERWEATSPNSSNTRDALASASDATQAAIGATSGRTATATRAGRSIGTLLALRPNGSPPPPPPPPPPPGDPVFVGAGDIAGCDTSGDEATAALLDDIGGTVYTTGDNVYENATLADYNNCYGPTWGQFKDQTVPVAGNHEYLTANASGYFTYFGAAAGDPAKGYYDTTIGDAGSAWHVIVLNSNCSAIGGCGVGSPQETWLRSVLASSTAPCTVALWHHPRFSSQGTNGDATYQPFWQALYDFGADVILNGHQHVYERFAPQTPTGVPNATSGIRQFTVGSGGRSHGGASNVRATSERLNNDTFGVLKLTLHANSYDWQFVPEAGKTFTDSGTTACH